MKPRHEISRGKTYVAVYEDGSRAPFVIPNSWKPAVGLAGVMSFASEGQFWRILPEGKIVAIKRTR
jgi:hypothetical protein